MPAPTDGFPPGIDAPAHAAGALRGRPIRRRAATILVARSRRAPYGRFIVFLAARLTTTTTAPRGTVVVRAG